MKLGIAGAVSLVLGIWALKSWWWFVVDFIQAAIAVALVVGGILALAIAVRRVCAGGTSAPSGSCSD